MNQLSKEEAAKIALRGYQNPRFFCKFFLQEWFKGPMPPVHLGLLAILTRKADFLLEFDEEYTPQDLEWILANFLQQDGSPIFVRNENGIQLSLGKYTLVMMPRGSSKTTICNAVNIWLILYQDCKFPVFLSETDTHAARQLTNVAVQLCVNQRILAVFGSIRPDQRQGLKWSESEGFIQTSTGISVAARGRGSQVRGLNVNAQRPDRIIVDDVEDKESVKTVDQRIKTKEWFYGDVLPALPELDPTATVVVLGTLLHQEALLTSMIKDPEWTTVHFGVLDQAGQPIWPQWMNLDKVEKKKQSYASKGLLHIFYLEYFNTIRNEETAKFRMDMLKVEPVALADVPFRAIAIDPAISDKKDADFCAIAVVGMRENGIIQVLDLWMKRGATPREQIDKYFEMKFLWKTKEHGVESIAYQAALIHLLKEEMFRKAKTHGTEAYFEITPIVHSSSTKKTERVEGILQPRYAAGYVRHQREFPELVSQLLDWPNGKKDGPDVVAMAASLLDNYAPMANNGNLTKDTYEPLDAVFAGDWRRF